MNSETAVRPKRGGSRRSDQEFLPAALEILETPASPVRLAMIVMLAVIAVSALVWAYLSKIEIVAIGQGKIQPAGRVKIVQPVETGRVVGINAGNGEQVQQGSVLLRLDMADAAADVASTQAEWFTARAEALRREVAVAAAGGSAGEPPAVAWPPDIPAEITQREDAVLKADLGDLFASLDLIEAKRRQREAERKSLQDVISAQRQLVGTLEERVQMYNKLVDSQAGSRAKVLDALEPHRQQQKVLAEHEGGLFETETALAQLRSEAEKTLAGFVRENVQRGADADRSRREFEQRLAKARARLDRLELRAPISGTIEASAVHAQGQVVTTGQEVMRIVPETTLEIEMYLRNKDIGFVSVGDPATVKVEAFPYTRYGMLDATVREVARDAIPEPDAAAIEGNPAASGQSTWPGGIQRTQNLVFPVRLALKQDFLTVDGKATRLKPGMAVGVEIQTGKRRVLEYLFSPLVEVSSQALRER
jgi:hemolysin D